MNTLEAGYRIILCEQEVEGGSLTTIKSLLAPMTRIFVALFGTEGTGSAAFSFLKSNSGNLELSFISAWYLQESRY